MHNRGRLIRVPRESDMADNTDRWVNVAGRETCVLADSFLMKHPLIVPGTQINQLFPGNRAIVNIRSSSVPLPSTGAFTKGWSFRRKRRAARSHTNGSR
jgi:hypothetical protein